MQTSHLKTRSLIAAATLALIAAPVAAQSNGPMYRLVELRADGGGSTKAYALNNTGQVVGWMNVGETRHAGHWHVDSASDLHGTVHFDLQHPYALFDEGYAEAYDISNADQIVGTARTAIDCPPKVVITNAYMLRPAMLTDLGTPYPGDALTNLRSLGFPCGDPNSFAPGAPDSAATGISNRNHVVGWADNYSGVIRAFLLIPRGGQFYIDEAPDFGVNDLMIDLGTLRADTDPVSSASAVNDFGQVTGYSYTLASPAGVGDPLPKAAYHAFLVTPNDTDADGDGDEWYVGGGDGENGLMEDLGTLGGYNSWGRDINNAEQVVGESDTDPSLTDGHYTHAFLWEAGEITDLGTLGGDSSAASAINEPDDDGEVSIVGWASDSDGQRHAFLYRDGEMYDLNALICTQTTPGTTFVPNITLTEARDVNDDGWIAGWGAVRGSAGQETHGFLLIPIDPNDCIVEEEETGGDTGTGGGSGGGGGTVAGSPMIGTPGNLEAGGDGGTGGEPGAGAAPVLCGFGTFTLMPLTLAGLCWMRPVARRRFSRRG